MEAGTYTPRVVDRELDERLGAVGAVVIEGPRACGKTQTGRFHAKSEVLFDVDATARSLVEIEPQLVLSGDTPRLLDEWQTAPAVWNHVRRWVDDRKHAGQFILTGSAVPSDDRVRHTGAGRVARIRMRPMTLTESGFGDIAVSLRELWEGRIAPGRVRALTVSDYIDRMCVGGWPGWVELPVEAALWRNRDYVDEIARTDIERVDGVRRDPDRVRTFMRHYSRNVGTLASLARISGDERLPGDGLRVDTAREYLNALQRLMVVEEVPPWQTHLRSRARQTQAAKRAWVDPSIAVACLRTAPPALLRDLEFVGLLFESLAIRELSVYAQATDSELSHYRDSNGLEVDIVVQRSDGAWGACEVKLGMSQVDTAAEQLLRFAANVDKVRMGEPAFLAVIVGVGEYTFRRPDGIVVIPLAALGA